MSDRNSCIFGDIEYSDGSLICSNGRELRCDNGVWQETGYLCPDVIASNDDHEHFDDDAEAKRIASLLLRYRDLNRSYSLVPEPAEYREKSGSCRRTHVGHSKTHITLENICNKYKQFPITWNVSGSEKTLKYRFSGRGKREILFRGSGASYGTDEEWDTEYGSDVSNKITFHNKVMDGVERIGFFNHTKYFVCCTFTVREQKSPDKNNSIMLNPNKATYVHVCFDPGTCQLILKSANADPE